MSDPLSFDAYAPREIAARVEALGVAKARLALAPLAMLGVLAGVFIGLGALMYTLVLSDASLGFAAQRVLGGLVFSLGLLMVSVAGAELFTGNSLLAMAWAERRIGLHEVLRNWVVVALANALGAAALALAVAWSGHGALNGGAVGRTAQRIALAKAELGLGEAFWRGVLCNLLVCMAVWMSLAGRSVVDKAVAVVFPVMAFVAAGFEHSIANLYFLPLGALLGAPVPWADALLALAVVIGGNLVGGSLLVAGVYWLIYLRPAR